MNKIKKYLVNLIKYNSKTKICTIILISILHYSFLRTYNYLKIDNYSNFYIAVFSSLITIISILIAVYGIFLSSSLDKKKEINEKESTVLSFINDEIYSTLKHTLLLLVLIIIIMVLNNIVELTSYQSTLFIAVVLFILLFTIISMWMLITRLNKFYKYKIKK